MPHTRIPPPRHRQDQIDDFVYQDSRLYFVEEAKTRRILSGTLSQRALMEFLWTHDGRDYRIEPRMGTALDDIGRDTGVSYQVADLFGREWDVYFKNDASQPWRKSRITAYGQSEREAVIDLLNEGFRREAWSPYFYVRQWGVTDLRDLGLASGNGKAGL